MSAHHSHVSMAAPALTRSIATGVPVHQRTSVTPVPRRTVSLTIRVAMVGRVMALACAAVVLVS